MICIHFAKWLKQHISFYLIFFVSQFYAKLPDYLAVGLSSRRTIELLDYRVVGLSSRRTIEPSDYRAVGLSICSLWHRASVYAVSSVWLPQFSLFMRSRGCWEHRPILTWVPTRIEHVISLTLCGWKKYFKYIVIDNLVFFFIQNMNRKAPLLPIFNCKKRSREAVIAEPQENIAASPFDVNHFGIYICIIEKIYYKELLGKKK